MVPTRTRSPDDAASPSAISWVTVMVENSRGGTPAQSTYVLGLVEGADGDEDVVVVPQPGLVEAAVIETGNPVASSSIRQPESVCSNVALPVAPGASSVASRAGLASWVEPSS